MLLKLYSFDYDMINNVKYVINALHIKLLLMKLYILKFNIIKTDILGTL